MEMQSFPRHPPPLPSTKLGQHLGPPGLPSLWNAEESSEAFWHQLPVLSPQAPTVAASFAMQTFFALTPIFSCC